MRTFLSLLLLSLLSPASTVADWPQFRGPDGQGHSDAKGIPVEWSEGKNVKWKMPVPGQGFSSPVISGGQIWMTSSEMEGKSLHAICLDLATGKLLHNIEVITTDDAGPRHRLNGYASPTPVLDEKYVYVHFGPRGTVCLNRNGKIIWKNTGFKYNVIQGGASSPILHGDLLLLTCDGIDFQFIVALEKETGNWPIRANRYDRRAELPKKQKRLAEQGLSESEA